MNYMYVTQNDIPYRLHISKKNIKDIIIDICWQFNLFNCKKFNSQKKLCQSYILIVSKYHDSKPALDILKQLPVKQITIWKKLPGHLIIQQEIKNDFPIIELNFILEKDQLIWIKTWVKQQKCTSCGRIYTNTHSCDFNRSSFYYNKIDSSKKFWEPITFQPIGELPNTKKLFLVYDIETFTLTETQGTQLVPVLLCFSIYGDTMLTEIAKEEIIKNKHIKTHKDHFYWLSTEKNFISTQFRNLRDQIFTKFIDKFIEHILTKENFEILNDFKKTKNLQSFMEINITEEKDLLQSLKVSPLFIEFYIVGHNIQSFDEILLASQILQTETLSLSPFLTTNRNFLPRQGKILFNDITISFPYPDFFITEENNTEYREIIQDAKEGNTNLKNLKNIYVKSMVRDTFQLTHASLRNAAAAYNLPTAKGYCPFQAVNDYFSKGTYKQEEDFFPDKKYWSSETEFREQYKIWKSKNIPTYDLVQELIDYCIQDVIVTQQLATTLYETFNKFVREEFKLPCNFNVFKRPTISSNSHAIFRQLHYSQYGCKINKLPDIMAPSNEMYHFIRQSVRGGRCYPTFYGSFTEKLYVYDICGMYASALTHPMPYGVPVGEKERLGEIKKLSELLASKQQISYFTDIKPMIVVINALPPPPELLDPLPPLCSKKSGKLCWTNEALYQEIVTSIDIITLHNKHWKVEILPHKLNTVFPSWNTCCADYVKVNILAKEKASTENNQVKRAISKLLSNALYGSFATKEDNEVTIFEQSLKENSKIKTKLNNNLLTVANISSIPTNSLPSSSFSELNFNLREKEKAYERYLETDEELLCPFNSDECLDEESSNTAATSAHHMITYKPFNIVNVTPDNLTIYTLKSTEPFPTNKKYPTQLASFVLAWTRAFISDWSNILYHNENHIPIQRKTIKAIYGDTDSLFLTQQGHDMMLKYGTHRLKSKTSKLVYDPDCKELTWSVECETTCSKCYQPGFCSESIFLAPKLYGLKDITCLNCKITKPGKLRAKGHAADDITFEILKECFNYHKTTSNPTRRFTTERTSLKKTLCKSYGKFSPFTIHQIKLIRELRPWKDPTLYFITDNLLIPYDQYHPNPRPTPTFLLQEFHDDNE
ncbi:MAG: DNA polymerase [psittacine adenovirus 7]|uniref:DNA polymerase n=1 Tax=psittacine adenovirus 7 TaxID=2848040 RepID=A0A6B9LXW1_9ADEN|nr:MAG: DNA polymerase [psittacine adenovirus 7]QHB43549.1 MAG: DNA polymerase [psittacine adenovirus 7]